MKNDVKISDLFTENLKLRRENQELKTVVKVLAILLVIGMICKFVETFG